MAQVPIQTTPTVSASGAGNPFVQGGRVAPVTQPNAGGTAKNIGASMTEVGKLMMQLQVQHDEQKVKQTTVAYLNELNTMEAGLKAKVGTNAIESFPDYQKGVADLNKRYEGLLDNDAQRGVFSGVSARYSGSALTSGATYVFAQQRNVNIAASNALAEQAANSSIGSALDGDSRRAADHLASGAQHLRDAFQLKGASKEETDLAVQKYTSDALISTATGYLSAHKLQLASAYLEAQHKSGALIEEDYIKTKTRIKDALGSHNGVVDALNIFQQAGGDYTKAFSKAAAIGGERGIKTTNALLAMRERSQAVDRAVAEERATKFNTAWDQQREFTATGNAAGLDPGLLSEFSPEEQQMLMAGPAKFNTSAAETEVMAALKTGGKGWDTFKQTRLPLLRGSLTEESYNSFTKISNPGEVAKASVNEDMLKNALYNAGYGDLADAKRYRIRKMVDDRILSAQIDKGRALTEPEKSLEIAKVLGVVIEDDAVRWTFTNTSKRAFQVSIADIPEIERDALRTALTNAGKLTGDKRYDEQAIVDTWLRLKTK